MGTRGLQGLGGRPQGRGCLLLAVAGATSLVTLLLAVPITVLGVLALVPQDQGRRVEKAIGSGAQAQKRLDDNKPSCILPSPSSLSETPDPRLHPQGPYSSRNLGSTSQRPVAQSSREASAWVTLSPAVESTTDSGVQHLPKGVPESDLSPELPAAHLIGKHLVDRAAYAFGSAMTLLVLSQLLHQ